VGPWCVVADTPLAAGVPVGSVPSGASASGEGASSRVAPAAAEAPRALGSVISVLPSRALSASASATFAAARGSKTVEPSFPWLTASIAGGFGRLSSGLLDFATGPEGTGAASSRARSLSTKSPSGRKSAPASRTRSAATDASCFRSRQASHSAT
jgi:hypothetical protein